MYCWFVCINLYEMGSMYRWYHLPYAFVHSPLLHHMWSIVTAFFIASRSQNCTFQPQLPPKQLSNDWWFQPIPKVWVMFGSSSQISEDLLWMLVDSFPTWSAQWKSLRTTRHLVCHLRFCTWLVRKWVDHGGSWWTLALISQKDGLMAQHGRQVVFGPCVLVYMMYEVTICWMIRIHMCAKTYA